MAGDATQDRFLGAILGMAIGDAFGMPVAGLSAETIKDVYGTVAGYLPRTFANGDAVNPGEITDETEFALCIIESVTAAQGMIDVENIGIRMCYLARGDSRRWMSEQVAYVLDGRSEASGFQVPLHDDEPVSQDVLSRGVPIGLLHSMGRFDPVQLRADAELVTRITHGNPLALRLVEATSLAIAYATRRDYALNEIAESVRQQVPDSDVSLALARDPDVQPTTALSTMVEALAIAASAETFPELLTHAAMLGGATDTRASLAAALYAGYHGSSVIPQAYIDDLEARIYVSLAVPWYFRTVARLRGRLVDIRSSAG